MGQVIQTNGDYNIKTQVGGTITLDTGPNGNVAITGNLVVQGDSTTVNVETLEIQDNIIVVNKGETGEGVSLTYAGLKVDRGFFNDSTFNDSTLDGASRVPPSSIVWDESIDSWAFYSGPEDNFVIDSNSRLTLRELRVDPIAFNGNLLINITTGVIEVPGDVVYEDRVVNDNHIPNKRYVDDRIVNNPSFQIRSDNTRVYAADRDISGSLADFTSATGFNTFGESAVSVIVDGNLVGQFYPDKVFLEDLEFNDNEITTSSTNENLFFRTQGTGKLQTNFAIQLDKISGQPAFVSNALLIHGATPGLGTSGVWFVNDSQNTANNNASRYRTGELISKNKALVFSMIF